MTTATARYRSSLNFIRNSAAPMNIAMLIAFVVALITIPPILFTNYPSAGNFLLAHGYQDITLTGYSPMGCQHTTDLWSTTFKARSPEGANTSGIVCENTKHLSVIIIESTSNLNQTNITIYNRRHIIPWLINK